MSWEFVENIDYSRRTINEWAKIYEVNLINDVKEDRLISEYEWAYFLCGIDYLPATKNLEKFTEMEQRAMELKRDVFFGASIGEKEILKTKYIEIEWVRKRLLVI